MTIKKFLNNIDDDELSIKLSHFNNQETINPKYSKTTKEVEVIVEPQFIDHGQREFNNMYFWAYHVTIINNNKEKIKLTHRHWYIIDGNGNSQEIDGQGVIGKKPTISPNALFSYSSGVHLFTNSGIMYGSYLFEKAGGGIFEVAIPHFSLDDPREVKFFN